MAYAIVPHFRKVICEKPCQHTDCATWSAFYKTPCKGCARIFKPGDSYTNYEGAAWHFVCAERDAEKKRDAVRA